MPILGGVRGERCRISKAYRILRRNRGEIAEMSAISGYPRKKISRMRIPSHTLLAIPVFFSTSCCFEDLTSKFFRQQIQHHDIVSFIQQAWLSMPAHTATLYDETTHPATIRARSGSGHTQAAINRGFRVSKCTCTVHDVCTALTMLRIKSVNCSTAR